MNRTILVDGFRDAGYPGCVYQVPTKDEVDIKVCDICEEEIPDGERLSGDGEEDFCICCHKAGKIKKYYVEMTGEELPFFLKRIEDQYAVIHLRKLPK